MNKERYKKIAFRYNLSLLEIEQLYHFSLKNDIHIYDSKILLDKYGEKYMNDYVQERKFGNLLEKWLKGDYKLYNSDIFKQRGIDYVKNGKYTDYVKNSHPQSKYMKFWREEIRRSIYGYLDGNEWVTGYNYFYINYAPIELTKIIDSVENNDGSKIARGERVVETPYFWDGDLFYFKYLEEAERHGLSAVVIKCRGRGFSWKAASMVNRNFYLIPRSRSIIYAGDDEYLVGGDGVLTKAWSQMSFLDEHTPFAKKKQKKNTEHHRRASMVKNENGVEIESGFLSEIIGKTLNQGSAASRGKRAKLILYEEAGSFKKLLESWIVSKPSVMQGNITYGLRVAFGTGGHEGASFEGLRKLFYEPKVYDIQGVSNLWTAGASNNEVGWFQPEYVNREGFYDNQGNSDILMAKEKILEERTLLTNSGADIDTILRTKAEQPITPEEAILRTSGSPFPRQMLKEQQINVTTNKEFSDTHRGRLIINTSGDVLWVEDNTVNIIEGHNPSKLNITGGIEIFAQPMDAIKETTYGYIIGVDPIDFDFNEINQDKFSLGSCFVMNSISKQIVAEYTGRPEMADTFYENVRRLALYYNATIMYENNIKGLYTYFINRYSENLLALKPQILDDNGMLVSTGRRKYGYNANERVNKLGLSIIRKWLKETIDDSGNLLMLNTIKSKGLLDELVEWNPDGNFDRVSALIATMIFYKEIERLIENGYNDVNKSEEAKFWTKPFKYSK